VGEGPFARAVGADALRRGTGREPGDQRSQPGGALELEGVEHEELVVPLQGDEEIVAERREGPFTIRANIDDLRSGSIKATGDGLFLPAWAEGDISVRYSAS